MATNTVIFDQIYSLLEKTREILRLEYDQGAENPVRMLHFRMKGNKAVRCEEDDDGAVPVTVAWDNNNANLRTLARETMHNL